MDNLFSFIYLSLLLSSFFMENLSSYFILFLLILTVELLNTAIENIVDFITKEYHPLAKKAKDCGSAATFIVSLITLVLGSVILFIM